MDGGTTNDSTKHVKRRRSPGTVQDDNNPTSEMLLRLTSDMFRQHSDLFLQQAAVLERVASHPTDPSSWKLEEPSPESVQDRLFQENVTTLAIQSYESMLQVQKRVAHLQRLMIRNGMSKRTVVKPYSNPVERNGSKDPTQPFYWFLREHAKRIGDQIGQSYWQYPVLKQALTLWKTTNPLERKPYLEKAEKAANFKKVGDRSTIASVAKRSTTTRTVTKKEDEHESKGEGSSISHEDNDDDSDDDGESSSSTDDEEKPLFQRDAKHSVGRLSNDERSNRSSDDDNDDDDDESSDES